MKKLFMTLIAVFFASGSASAADFEFVSIKGLIEQEVGRVLIPEFYKKIGMTVDIQPLSGKRAQKEATSGKKDGEIMRIHTYGENNPTTIRVPTPYYQLETMAFAKKDANISISSKEELKNYKLMKVSGVKHTTNITKGYKNVKDAKSTQAMMKSLNAGRVDIGLTNTVDGKLVLKKMGNNNISAMDKPLAVLDLYHYIHKDHADLVGKIDQVIKEMKASGELEALIKKAEKQVIDSQ